MPGPASPFPHPESFDFRIRPVFPVNFDRTQTGVRPDAQSASPTIAMTSTAAAGSGAATNVSSTVAGSGRMNVTMAIGDKGSTLNLSNGGVRLPNNTVSANE